MATQTLEFDYVAGLDLTAKLFPVDNDTQEGDDVEPVEETNRNGCYHAEFTDVAAGVYKLRVYVGGVFAASYQYVLALATAVYRPAEDALAVGLSAGALTQIQGTMQGTTIQIVSPLSKDGKRLKLVQGDDYAAANGRSITFEIVDSPGLVGSKAVLRLAGLSADACESPEITQATQDVVMGDLLAAVTSLLTVSDTQQDYQIRFVKGSLVASVIQGKMIVDAQV